MNFGFTWHEILHVHGLLTLPIVLDADGGQGEEDGRAEGHGHPDPGNDVAPVVLELGVVRQNPGPGLDKELRVRRLRYLHLFIVLHAVPQAHRARAEQA